MPNQSFSGYLQVSVSFVALAMLLAQTNLGAAQYVLPPPPMQTYIVYVTAPPAGAVYQQQPTQHNEESHDVHPSEVPEAAHPHPTPPRRLPSPLLPGGLGAHEAEKAEEKAKSTTKAPSTSRPTTPHPPTTHAATSHPTASTSAPTPHPQPSTHAPTPHPRTTRAQMPPSTAGRQAHDKKEEDSKSDKSHHGAGNLGQHDSSTRALSGGKDNSDKTNKGVHRQPTPAPSKEKPHETVAPEDDDTPPAPVWMNPVLDHLPESARESGLARWSILLIAVLLFVGLTICIIGCTVKVLRVFGTKTDDTGADPERTRLVNPTGTRGFSGAFDQPSGLKSDAEMTDVTSTAHHAPETENPTRQRMIERAKMVKVHQAKNDYGGTGDRR